MDNVLYINEREDQHCAEIFPFNLMLMLAGETPDRTILAHNPVYTSQAPTQRCFNQFDRKTDCLRKGLRAAYRRMAGKYRKNVYPIESVNWPQNSLLWVSRYLSLAAKRRCGNGDPFTQAVCGTQTRMPEGFKFAIHDVFRPERTGLRRTPRGWLPSNVRTKDHPGFMVVGQRCKERPLSH